MDNESFQNLNILVWVAKSSDTNNFFKFKKMFFRFIVNLYQDISMHINLSEHHVFYKECAKISDSKRGHFLPNLSNLLIPIRFYALCSITQNPN